MCDYSDKRVWILLWFIGVFICSSVIFASSQLAAEQAGKMPVRSSNVAALSTEDIDPVMLQKKLDEIYKNQQKILDKFQTILDEIQIVKVRATVR